MMQDPRLLSVPGGLFLLLLLLSFSCLHQVPASLGKINVCSIHPSLSWKTVVWELKEVENQHCSDVAIPGRMVTPPGGFPLPACRRVEGVFSALNSQEKTAQEDQPPCAPTVPLLQ